MTRLHWNDPEAMQGALDGLRVALADIDAVVQDMLRPVSERELGRRNHRDLYTEAMGKATEILGYIAPETGGAP